MAPLFIPGIDELEEQVSAARGHRQIPDLVDDEQGETAEVTDAIAQRAVALSLGERRDDVCERTEVDAPAGFDRFDPEGQAQMRLAGSGRAYEMHGFGAIDELQSGER